MHYKINLRALCKDAGFLDSFGVCPDSTVACGYFRFLCGDYAESAREYEAAIARIERGVAIGYDEPALAFTHEDEPDVLCSHLEEQSILAVASDGLARGKRSFVESLHYDVDCVRACALRALRRTLCVVYLLRVA